MSDEIRLEKIARMALYDVPYKQIASALGLSEGRITQLMEEDEYKTILEEIASEHFEKHNSPNNGWDSIEATAMNNILTHCSSFGRSARNR